MSIIRYGNQPLSGLHPNAGSGNIISYRNKGGASPLDPDTTLFYNFFEDQSLIDSVSGIPLTFTRSSLAWSYDAAGLLVENAIDTPRFDHDPVTLTSLGLLIEGARTNLCLWSRNGAQSAWIKSSTLAVVDQVGIDGVAASATRITATAPNATLVQSFTGANVNRAFSVSLKRITGTGVVEITGQVDTGWVPVTLTSDYQRFTVVASNLNPIFGIRIVTSGDEVAMDVAQLEDGDFESSPIITAASIIIRDLESCFTVDLSWWDSTVGTWYVRWVPGNELSSGFDQFIYSLADFSSALRASELIFRVTNTNQYIARGGAISIISGSDFITKGQSSKYAVRDADGDSQVYIDGVMRGDSAFAAPNPVPVRLRLGANRSNGAQIYGHIAVFAYANVGKGNAFLQSVTTP